MDLRHLRALVAAVEAGGFARAATRLGISQPALTRGETGVLRVGATPQMIENLLATFRAHHRRRHTGVEIRLVEDGTARLPARLERGEVHLALIVAPDARFASRPLFPVCALAVWPAAQRLGRRAAVEVGEIAREPLRVSARDLRVAALLQKGVPLAGWVALSWNARRLLPRHAERFGAELEAYARRAYPGRAAIRRAPPVPRPRDLGVRVPDEAP